MVDVPEATPETIPDADPTVATDGLIDVHVPAPAALARVVVAPTQTVSVPVIVGKGFTVTTVVAEHPPIVYEMMAVPPNVPTPVTTPVDETVATPVALLLQVPPDVASNKVVVLPVHTEVVPVIAGGAVQATVMIASPAAQL